MVYVSAKSLHIQNQNFLFRFNPTEGVIDATKVTLPLVISFASKAFELYAVIRIHNDEEGGIKYDAVVFNVSKSVGGTKQAVRIDEHGVKSAFAEFNDLQKISSTNVVLALYDDIIGKFELFPKPIPEIKTEVNSIDMLSPIGEILLTILFTHVRMHEHESFLCTYLFAGLLQPSHNERIVLDEWAERLKGAKQKDYVIHDVLPRIIDCESYLPHDIPKCKNQ